MQKPASDHALLRAPTHPQSLPATQPSSTPPTNVNGPHSRLHSKPSAATVQPTSHRDLLPLTCWVLTPSVSQLSQSAYHRLHSKPTTTPHPCHRCLLPPTCWVPRSLNWSAQPSAHLLLSITPPSAISISISAYHHPLALQVFEHG
jgi:hypothetical protein